MNYLVKFEIMFGECGGEASLPSFCLVEAPTKWDALKKTEKFMTKRFSYLKINKEDKDSGQVATEWFWHKDTEDDQVIEDLETDNPAIVMTLNFKTYEPTYDWEYNYFQFSFYRAWVFELKEENLDLINKLELPTMKYEYKIKQLNVCHNCDYCIKKESSYYCNYTNSEVDPIGVCNSYSKKI